MPDQGSYIIEDGVIAWFDGPEWDDVAERAFEDSARDIEGYAKDNAPWEDRTGDARAGLSTKVENDDGLITLTLFHTVDYGLWLEVIQSGRFAIIMPTLEAMGPKAMADATDKVSNAREGHDL